MKRLAMIAALCGCSLSHRAAVSLRYAGIVPIVGGSLLVAEPLLSSGALDKRTTIAGNVIVIVGLAMIVASLAADPTVPDDGTCAR